jgi:hypothetical protein
MRAREAMKLHNRDQVQIRIANKKWEYGYVLGDPYRHGAIVMVTVSSRENSYRVVPHTEIR